MRSRAVLAALLTGFLGTGCTIHVVEHPGVPVGAVHPAPAWNQEPVRPAAVVQHEPARPARPTAAKPPAPVKPPSVATPREPRPTEVASKPRPKPQQPKPQQPKPQQPKPHQQPQPVAQPIRTVRDAGSGVVGGPSAHVNEHDDQHARAHRMQR